MPADPRPRREPTDDWDQLRLLVGSPEQEAYELLRPIVLFGQPIPVRARETGVPERTLRRRVARFDALGMRSLFADLTSPPSDRRLPAEIRQAIVALEAEFSPFGLREIATICQERFDRPVSHHTVKQVLTTEPLPLRPPRRFPPYHEVADSIARRRAVVTLYLDGWSVKAIAGYLATSRATVYEVLQRWVEEGWPGLADRPLGPHHPAGKVDLKAMADIRRLQANPELGEFRIHAALAQQGIHLSPRTCGRILALHRALGAPQPAAAVLGWVQGAWCDSADLDRLFRLRATRRLNRGGSVRFRHWRLYGERGLAGERAAVWVWDETLTIEHAAEMLAQYRVAAEPDGRRLREVTDARFFATGHASPQPFLAPLEKLDWYPAQRVEPYRRRRRRADSARQSRLFVEEPA